jgi:L-alanine-DL-glutamate epimerase-like enolase superfamily enzyme
MTATTHPMCAIDNAGYFEANCSLDNPFRDRLIDPPIRIAVDGTIVPNEGPGLGVTVDEDRIRHYAGVDEPGYV